MKLRKIPRGTFWIGGLASLALGVPLISVAIHALSEVLGWGATHAPLDETFWISLIFAGIPTLVAGGGVARLVAHRLSERPDLSFGRALWYGGSAMAVAGMGLALLAAMPLGALPDTPRRWPPLAVAGLLCGAVTGLAVSVLAALRQRRFGPPAEPGAAEPRPRV